MVCFRFLSGRTHKAHLLKRNPREVTWTVLYRRKHKKGQEEDVSKKRNKRTQKFQRAVVGATLAVSREFQQEFTKHLPKIRPSQHPRATAITFEFGRHIDTYTKVPQHPKIPNPFLVKLKK